MSHWIKPKKLPSSTKGVFSLAVMKQLSRIDKRIGKKRGKRGRQRRQMERTYLRGCLYKET